MIKEYHSTVSVPQMVFLGLDGRSKDGLVWKNVYKGAPTWAVDVTPKGTGESQAKELIKEVESKGLHFQEGRMILSLEAREGTSPFKSVLPECSLTFSSCDIRTSTSNA